MFFVVTISQFLCSTAEKFQSFACFAYSGFIIFPIRYEQATKMTAALSAGFPSSGTSLGH